MRQDDVLFGVLFALLLWLLVFRVRQARFRVIFGMLLGLLLWVLLCAGCIGGPLTERKGGVFAEHTSPRGHYKVSLTGRPGAKWIGGVHVIRAAVSKGNVMLVSPREIYYSGPMDDSFNNEYCGADWAFENVLRFQGCHPRPNASHRTSELIIKNARRQAITFLRVSTIADMVLVIYLEGERSIRLPITGRTDGNWLHVNGLWADGQELPTGSANFHDLTSQGSEFEIVIDTERVAVGRRDQPSNGTLR
jgi:hypothetical protein